MSDVKALWHMHVAWLASVPLHLLIPPLHGVLEFLVDSFAGRPRQQLGLVAFVDEQQRGPRGLAGAILCADRTQCVDCDAGCSGPVADPFGCVRGSQLWWQSFPPENAKFGG